MPVLRYVNSKIIFTVAAIVLSEGTKFPEKRRTYALVEESS